MALVTEKPVKSFDLTQIECGYLLWAKHSTWSEGKAGFVTAVTENQLIVQYHPRIGNVTNHFIIPINEVIEGQWEIRWSADMAQIQKYVVKEDNDQPESNEIEESGEMEGGEDNNDTGGIDS
ncbi:MAG: DUF5026 domain-containing protein [Lachnospiraceae bacterium]|nr:DUF5026 domain-containing protein [Lachnospiraceae bacterium]